MRLPITCLLALCCLAQARAEGPPLDLTSIPFEKLTQTEVITASKLAKQVSDSPSAVSIVTADDIRAYGYRTLADVVNGMRGLYTTYDRRYEYLGGRGFGAPGDYTGRIMVLIDGTATQDNIYNQAYIDNSGLLDLELIERVEYVPGTGSVSYGNNALLGIINIITKRGADFDAAQLAGELSSYGGRKSRLTLGHRFENGVDLLLSASGLHSDGQTHYFPYFDAIGLHGGRAVGQDFESNRRLFAKLEFEGFSLQAAHVSRTKASPTPRRQNAFNLPYYLVDESTSVSAKVDFNIGRDLKSLSRLYLGRYEDRTFRQYVAIDPDEQFRRNKTLGQWWGLDQKFALTRYEGHTLVFGAEYRDDFRQRISSVGLDDHYVERIEYDRLPYTNKTYSLYATDEFAVSKALTANLGVRYDKPHAVDCSVAPCITYASKPAFSPRLAFTLAAGPDTTLKASYSRAFRLPNPNEISASTQSDLYRPERVGAAELVLEQDWSPTLRFTGSIYDYRLGNQRYQASASGAELHDGRSRTRGLEIQLDQLWEGGIKLRASAAWQAARDPEGKQLVNSPRSMAKLNLSAPLWERSCRLGLEAQYLGRRITQELRDDDGIVTREGRPLAGASLLNLTLSSAQGWHGLNWSIGIKNALNQRYEVPASTVRSDGNGAVLDTMAMDGRHFFVQLSWDAWR